MALTIVVLASEGEDGSRLSITLDAPRIVIGRGDGCEVRLPDPSVSQRHASIRQRGAEYTLVDEGSQNGTWLGRRQLSPRAPDPLRDGDRVRVGRVWLEIRIGPALPLSGPPATAARELALALVERGLRAQGEDPAPEDVSAALAELGRCPDQPVRAADVPDPPGGVEPAESPAPPSEDAPDEASPAAPSADYVNDAPLAVRRRATAPQPRRAGWGLTDAAVVLLALGVLAVSIAGLTWLLKP